jgi:probable rRNA maturation factor
MVKVTVHNLQSKYLFKISKLQRRAEKALGLLRKEWPAGVRGVDVYLVSSVKIARLHRDFLDDPTPTDVITFEHGEIFVCPAVAERQRGVEGLSLQDEVLTYIVHGLLHLCGWDDHVPADYEKMRRRQVEILKKI